MPVQEGVIGEWRGVGAQLRFNRLWYDEHQKRATLQKDSYKGRGRIVCPQRMQYHYHTQYIKSSRTTKTHRKVLTKRTTTPRNLPVYPNQKRPNVRKCRQNARKCSYSFGSSLQVRDYLFDNHPHPCKYLSKEHPCVYVFLSPFISVEKSVSNSEAICIW
jgi:hypothetical protein